MQLRTTNRNLKIEFEVIYSLIILNVSRQFETITDTGFQRSYYSFSRIVENLIAWPLRVRAPTLGGSELKGLFNRKIKKITLLSRAVNFGWGEGKALLSELYGVSSVR